VHFGIEVLRVRIAVNVPLRGENQMLRVSWLLHQPSHAFDNVSTAVFDRALVIAISSHNFNSV
jgi:hypothetical protein